MTVPTDFEKIAREIVQRITGSPQVNVTEEAAVVEARLRQVWNARGAADDALMKSELADFAGTTIAGPWIKRLSEALRTLDR